MNASQQSSISAVLAAKGKSPCVKCAIAPSLGCLNCNSEVHSQMGANQNLGDRKEMSTPQNSPLDAEAVKAMIDQHSKNLS